MDLPNTNNQFFGMLMVATILFFFEMEASLPGVGFLDSRKNEHAWPSNPLHDNEPNTSYLITEKHRRTAETEDILEGNHTLPSNSSCNPSARLSTRSRSSSISCALPDQEYIYPKRLSSSKLFVPSVGKKDFLLLMQSEEDNEHSRKELLQRFFQNQQALQEQKNRLAQTLLKKKQEIFLDNTTANITSFLPILPIIRNRQYSQKIKIDEVQKKYHHQQFAARVAEKIASYDIEFEWLCSYLPRRNAFLAQQDAYNRSNTIDSNSQQSPEVVVTDALQIAQRSGSDFLGCFSVKFVDSPNFKQIYSTLEEVDDRTLSLIIQVINLVRKTQLLTLGCHSPHYITVNKEELIEVEGELKGKIEELTQFDHTPYYLNSEIQKRYLHAQELLENSKIDFSFMEAASAEEETINAAERSTTLIDQLFQETNTIITSSKTELEETDTKHQESLSLWIKKMEELRDLLLRSMLSYRAISDEASIEKKYDNLNELKKEIEQDILNLGDQKSPLLIEMLAQILHPHPAVACEILKASALESDLNLSGISNTPSPHSNPHSPSLQDTTQNFPINEYETLCLDNEIEEMIATVLINLKKNLKKILSKEVFYIDEQRSSPATPFKFLDSLPTLDHTILSKRIIGTNGKVALDDRTSSTEYTDKMRREFFSGIKLMQLAICREFGLKAASLFAKVHFIKLNESNPLTGLEVKNFLFDAKTNRPKYHSSFFINPKMLHDDFLKILLHKKLSKNNKKFLNKVIKIDEATLSFNPFSKNSSNSDQPITIESLKKDELEQREKGRLYVREVIEKTFSRASLPQEEMDEVLDKFDQQFHVSKGSLLTLEATYNFIEKERIVLSGRSWWEKNATRYVNQEVARNIRNGFFFNIGNHLGTAMILLSSYLYYLYWTHTTPAVP